MKTNAHCDPAVNHLIAELELNPEPNAIFSELLEVYPDCRDALTEVFDTWMDLNALEVPEPSASMHADFYRALNDFEVQRNAPESARVRTMVLPLMRYAAAGLVLLVAGIFIGRQTTETLGGYSFEVQQPTSTAVTNVAWMSSTTERLEVIENTRKLNKPDENVLAAVNSALCNDESVNVRLSAIEALLHFAEYPMVRTYLIDAIVKQDSPIVQIALADAITAIQEKSAIQLLHKMIESGTLGLDVEDHYENAIKILM